MSKSRWSKMTDAEKKAYYAARKARKAAKAKAVDPAKKPDTKKPALKACKKACPCKAEPKNVVHVDGEDLSLSENAVLNAVRVATDERVAIENAISRIGKNLLKLQRAIKPNVNYIKFMVDADGNFNGYYAKKPAKKSTAKKVPAKK